MPRSAVDDDFLQTPPELGNQYRDDGLLRTYLERVLPGEVHREIEGGLDRMGELAGGELYRMQLADRPNEPRLTRWDPWGRRIDEIELTPLWRRAERLAAAEGLVAIPYEAAHGALSRIHQFALVHLFTPSTDIYSCPLAMTDGAARTLLESGEAALVDRALPRLTARDPARFWTSGQWMTETSGGSDVGRSRTRAERAEDGTWRLWGRKWFTSATTSQMALALARPEGNPEGSRGLALFHVETRDEDGRLADIRILRLKDKLGTRKVPTAELALEGTPARLVGAPSGGVKAIVPMLEITRTWNAVSAVSLMRRALALAADYALRRRAFGEPLADKPLHLETLAGMRAELVGAFLLTFRAVELLGRREAGEASGDERRLLRALTPLAKLATGKQAVAVTSEALEAFGGAGYVEDTGLPVLLRDAQVLPIWEGTTNVLSLDLLGAVSAAETLPALRGEVERAVGAASGERTGPARAAAERFDRAAAWLRRSEGAEAERGARRFALAVADVLELALAVEHAEWASRHLGDASYTAAALRLAAKPPTSFEPWAPPAGVRALALGEPWPEDPGAPEAAPPATASTGREESPR